MVNGDDPRMRRLLETVQEPSTHKPLTRSSLPRTTCRRSTYRILNRRLTTKRFVPNHPFAANFIGCEYTMSCVRAVGSDGVAASDLVFRRLGECRGRDVTDATRPRSPCVPALLELLV